MLFWVIAAIMTAIATLALLGPVMRARLIDPDVPESHDVEVYNDQLSEIDRDLADGLVDPVQAEVARTEISRRLLVAARKVEMAEADAGRGMSRGVRRAAVIGMAVFMPLAAVTAYIELGQPGLGQLPLSARLQAEPPTSDIAALVARAEQHLAENPDDGRGWDVLGPIYLRTGRHAESAAAFQKAISLLGPSPTRLASLGEALFSAAGGVMTEEANLAFQTARELDSTDPRPQFFLAIGLEQSGKTTEAQVAFKGMLATAPADAPWVPAVQSRLAALEQDSRAAPLSSLGGPAPRNPTAADIAAAQNMSSQEREAMIGSMVEGLEAKLADNPDDISGWLRLVRSHVVTGQRDKAQVALDRAFAVFPPSGPEHQALSVLAGELELVARPTLGGVPMAPAAAAIQDLSVNTPSDAARTPFILPGAGAASAPIRAQEPAAKPHPELSGPSSTDIAEAAQMSGEDRAAMVRTMVASLDAKLADNPDNLEGWLRLVRSYAVLGDRTAAETALAQARLAFPDGSDGGRALAVLAVELGLEPAEDGQ
ncbi:c-type cytochrome biogenesis protein CcmI [Hoeflea sp. YIM 152468]|uniref:c-type cytochrome biogenesis protein CcmI n=1 Tax=Hoeflea sp. YIM 152468 TaxID=3031759 RepID=UPI0023D99301|nr:c-type cytochrome biogenesis protein CcmI [Hoeflea sp. YIM 152468]MDF1607265.1 c-type cytochrome biogenesis protein CcmI [Hoeflea sp. YIM 152468]